MFSTARFVDGSVLCGVATDYAFLPIAPVVTVLFAGFLMMPFSSAFTVNNTAVSLADLPLVFTFTGVASIVILPMAGKISDPFGTFKIMSCVGA